MTNYESIIQLVANSAEEVRKCDVYRLMESAKDRGLLDGFTDYLFGKQFELRPGVWEEVKECTEELK